VGDLRSRYLRNLFGGEPAALRVSESAAAIIEAKDDRIAELEREAGDDATLIATLRESWRHGLDGLEAKDAQIEALRRDAVLKGVARDVEAADLLERAERSERECADLRAELAEAMPGGALPSAEYVGGLVAARERVERALVALVPVMERFAAPGVITAGDRRKAASEALEAAHAEPAEVTP
jgi:hypothetical protein